MINTILHEHLQDSTEGKRNTIQFLKDLTEKLIESLDWHCEKEPEELTDKKKLALAIIAGCELEMEMNQDGNIFCIKTKNKIGIRKINGRFQVVESKR